jgi:hypothetical protein
MDVKKIILNQPAGLGDILFCLKIGKKFYDMGNEVLWPVVKSYLFLNDYLETPIKFISTEIELNYQNYNVIPLETADRVFPNKKIMESKYHMTNIDYNDWSSYFKIKRNKEKEDLLYYNILGLKDNEEYILVSKNYGTHPNYSKYPIVVNTEKKIVELDFYENFNLFDWCKVIENANEIHMIDSSINYLIEILTLKSKSLYLYSRRKNNFSEIDYLFKTKYILKYD